MTPDAVPYRPRQVQILLTERCNLKCRHCAVPEEDSPAHGELETDEWLAFIDRLCLDGVESLVLSGGEALLRPEAIDLATYALEHGISRTTLVTNGLLFRGDVPARIAASQRRHPTFGVHLSLDGASERTHDWMRGAGAFRRTMRAVERLRAAGGRLTGLHTVFHQGNVAEFSDCVKLAHRLGVEVWTVFPLASLGRGTAIQSLKLDESTWRDLITRLVDIEQNTGLTVGVMGPVLGEEWPLTASERPRSKAEHAMQTCVGPDGEIFTCPPLRNRPVGSVRTVLAEGSWLNAAERAGRLLQSECSSCELLLMCTSVDLTDPFQPAVAGHALD
jgi:radical SAM protein with 4Fe4S-binding SPASM domain